MKLMLLVPVVLSALPSLIFSFAPSISKDDLIPRVFSEPRPVEEPGRGQPDRPGGVDPAIIEQYPQFLEKVFQEGKNVMWLPKAENKEDLAKKPASGTSGIFIYGKTVYAQFGFDDLPKPAHNLRVSGLTSWRPGDEPDSDDEDLSLRQRSLRSLQKQGQTVGKIFESASAARARAEAEFKPPVYAQMGLVESTFPFALETAARLVAEHFKLGEIQYRVSGNPRRKRTNMIDQRGSEIDMSAVTPILYRHNPAAQLQARSGILDDIGQKVQGSGKSNATTDLITELELYQYALISVQSNISDLIFPFLDTMATKTNSDLVFDVLWSVYQDLIGSGNSTGPFMCGWNSLDVLQDQYMNHTNSSSTHNATGDPATVEYLAVQQTVLDIYNYAWINGSAAANKTGLLNDLAALSNYVLSLNISTLPPNFLTQSAPQYDYNQFRSRGPASGSNTSVFLNFTLPAWEK